VVDEKRVQTCAAHLGRQFYTIFQTMRFGAPSGQVLIFFDHEIAKDINRFFGFWEILCGIDKYKV
jgi:hypothetical protein